MSIQSPSALIPETLITEPIKGGEDPVHEGQYHCRVKLPLSTVSMMLDFRDGDWYIPGSDKNISAANGHVESWRGVKRPVIINSLAAPIPQVIQRRAITI